MLLPICSQSNILWLLVAVVVAAEVHLPEAVAALVDFLQQRQMARYCLLLADCRIPSLWGLAELVAHQVTPELLELDHHLQ